MNKDLPSGKYFHNLELKDVRKGDYSDFEKYRENGYQGCGYLNRKTKEIWSECYTWDSGNRTVVTVFEDDDEYSEESHTYVAFVTEERIEFHYFTPEASTILSDLGYSPEKNESGFYSISVDPKRMDNTLVNLVNSGFYFSGDYKLTYPPSYSLHLLQAKGILKKNFKQIGHLKGFGFIIRTIRPCSYLIEKNLFQQGTGEELLPRSACQ